MRISDWSSDVCSSDRKFRKLVAIEGLGPSPTVLAERAAVSVGDRFRKWIEDKRQAAGRIPKRYATLDDALARMMAEHSYLTPEQARSEERRVGKEWVSTCRSRW